MGDGQPRLLDQVRDRIRRKHYSIRTEKAYVDWIRRFVLHHNKRHSRDMGAVEVEGFLTGRPRRRTRPRVRSCSSTRGLGEPLPWLEGIESAKRPARLPVVPIRLLYGTGMRIMGARSLTGRVTGFILLLGITWAIIPCQNMEVNGGPTDP